MNLSTVREWWRGSTSDSGARTLRSRVALPSVVDAPQDVLRAVRQLNDDLDLYVMADGRVFLLKHEANKPRIREGRKMIEQAQQLGDDTELEIPRLMAEGWSLLGEFSYEEGCSVGRVVEHAQMTLYATRDEIEADQKRRKLIADGTTGRLKTTELMLERMRSSARSDHSLIMKNRKSYSSTYRST